MKKILVLGLLLTSCSNWKPVAKTVDQAAIILCDVFFSNKNMSISIDDIEKQFCSTAEQVAPFLDSAKKAAAAGGAARESK